MKKNKYLVLSIALTALVLLPPAFAAKASDLKTDAFLGCWVHETQNPCDKTRFSTATLCFKSNGRAHYSTVGNGDGWDAEYDWRYKVDNLVVDEQRCLIAPGATEKGVILTRCLYMGEWNKQCTKLTPDGTACAH